MSENKGFRVRIIFSTELNDEDKYLVYINLSQFKTVKEFIEHLKDTFRIDEGLCIKIDDCVLPDAETILVIQPDDILKVCKKESKQISLLNIKSNDNKSSFWESKERKKTSMDGIGDCLKLLWEKKSELENPATVKQDFDVHEQMTLDHSQNDCEENEVDDSEYSCNSVKKKRKRTRKRKNETSFTEGSICSSSKTFRDTKKQPAVENDMKKSNHIFFNEEPLGNEINAPQEKVSVHENHKSDSEGSNDDWKKKLLVLAKKTQDKVFDRSAQIRTMKKEPQFIVNIKDMNVGDCITFKVCKLSENNTPEVSSAIIGNILEINFTNQHLTLLITENKEAIINSDCMTAEMEADSSKKSQGIILKWTDLIEPQFMCSNEYFI